MPNKHGWRATVVAMALGAQLVVAQIGPRHAVPVAEHDATVPAPGQGRVELVGDGLALIRFQGLAILAVSADAEAYSKEARAGLPRRLPGADLVLLPAQRAPQLLALQRAVRAIGEPAPLTAAGYAFTPIKR